MAETRDEVGGDATSSDPARRRRLHRKHEKQLYKTHMCKYYLQGTCNNDHTCPFAHCESEIRGKPNLEKTSMCPRGEDCKDERCKFAHKPEELRATEGFVKTKMCSFAEQGLCRNGASCRFAHSPDELQKPEPVPPNRSKPKPPMVADQGAGYPEYKPFVPNHVSADGSQPGNGMRADASPWFPPPSRIQRPTEQASRPLAGPPGQFTTAANYNPRAAPVLYNKPDLKPPPDDVDDDNDDAVSSVSILSWHSSDQEDGHELNKESEASRSGPAVESSIVGLAQDHAASAAGKVRDEHRANGDASAGASNGGKPAEKIVTTLLLTNVPNYLTQGAFLYLLEDLYPDMKGEYDFFYCPWDSKVGKNSGYAMLNFPDAGKTAAFEKFWSDKEIHTGEKRLRILKAALQGLQPNVDLVSKLNTLRSAELRFRPLVRDSQGTMKPLILPGEEKS